MTQADSTEVMERFLLGELPEEERERLEEQMLVDDQIYEQMLTVEDDLLDAYARGGLTRAQRQAFGGLLAASPRLRRRADLAETLTRFCDAREPPREEPRLPWRAALGAMPSPPAMLRLTAAVAAVAVLSAGLWLASQRRETRRLAEREPGGEAIAEKAAPGGKEATQGLTAPQVATFVLGLGVRGADAPGGAVLPPGTKAVRLELDLEGDDSYDRFRVEIRDLQAGQVWSRDDVPAEDLDWGSAVVVEVPAGILAEGRHEVILLGVEDSGASDLVGVYELEVGRQ